MKRNGLLFTLLLFSSVILAQPTITAISPVSGAVGTSVTITGTNFDATPELNTVLIGGIKAPVLTASPTSLTIEVPAGIGNQPVVVTTANLTATASTGFSITFLGGAPMTTTSFAEPRSAGGAKSYKIVHADFNNDGLLDYACSDDLYGTASTGHVVRNISNKPGNLARSAKLTLTLAKNPMGVAVGDLDGDGRTDLIFSSGGGDDEVGVFRNTSTAGGVITFASREDFTAQPGGSPVIADLDGDGKPEVLVGGSAYIAVLRNTSSVGTIAFAALQNITNIGDYPIDISVVDIDGDGLLDIIAAITNDFVQILRNTSSVGAISFADPVTLPALNLPQSITTSDIDKDGKPDIAVSYYGDMQGGGLSVYRNISTIGSVAFENKIDFTLPSGTLDILSADVDGTGTNDLVVAIYGDFKAAVLPNSSTSGSISFDAAHYYNTATGGYAYHLSAADHDRDGHIDIFCAVPGADVVSILRNIGSGPTVSSFWPQVAGNGDKVYITGTGLANVSSVKFGDTQAASFTILSETSIEAVVSNGSHGDVEVKGSFGVALSNPSLGSFTYNNTPIIESFAPTGAGVGIPITIHGNHFVGVTEVTIGGLPAASFTINSKTEITAVVAVGAVSGDVTVTSPDGTDGLSGYSFLLAPTIALISPTTARTGQVVEITGTDLTTTTSVKFGSGEADSFVVNSDNSISAVVGLGTSGDVTVATQGGIATASGFLFKESPIITTFTPASGPIGTEVTITGSGFSEETNGNVVFFGDVQASIISANATTIVAIVPGGASNEPVTVTCDRLLASSKKPFAVTFDNGDLFHDHSFRQASAKPLTSTADEILTEDFNGDGRVDIISAVGSGGVVSAAIFKNIGTAENFEFADKADWAITWVSVTTGDVNGDGKRDIVTMDMENEVRIHLNTSTASEISFEEQSEIYDLHFGCGGGFNDIDVEDVDNDGRADIVVSVGCEGFVAILRNTSSQNTLSFDDDFRLVVIDESVQYPGVPDLALGDIDGDGLRDLMVVDYQSSVINVFRNIGSAEEIAFDTKIVLETVSNPIKLLTGDLNGDAKLDMVAITISGPDTITIFKNTSTPGSISFVSTERPTETNVTSALLADFNGDGKEDIVIGELGLSMLRNISTSDQILFETEAEFRLNYWMDLRGVGDFNNDGLLDIEGVGGTGSMESYIFENRSNKPHIESFTPSEVVAGDTVFIVGRNFTGATTVTFGGVSSASFTVLSGDSIRAIVGLGKTGDLVVQTPQGSASMAGVAYYNGPVITSITPLQAKAGESIIITGERFGLDSNTVRFGSAEGEVISASKDELVVIVPKSATHDHITVTTGGLTTYSKGKFTLTYDGTRKFSTSKFEVTSVLETDAFPEQVAIGDFNEDGKPDLAVANADNSVSIFTNQSSVGLPEFSLRSDLDGGEGPIAIVTADFDGDGKLDLAVANSVESTVSVFLNTSTGAISFGTKIDFLVSTNPQNLVVADFNNDGRPDIATVNFTSSNLVSVLSNTTDGAVLNFATPLNLTAGSFPLGIAAGDFNSDGKTDLAVTNSAAATVSTFRNTSAGDVISFATKVDYAVQSFPSSIACGDLDKNGALDMIVTNNSSNSLSYLWNYGSGFSLSTLPDALSAPSSINFADLNGDSNLDMIVANKGTSKSVTIAKNLGSGFAFDPPVSFVAGEEPTHVHSADIDGDGLTDIVSVDRAGNSVSIHLNIEPILYDFEPTFGKTGDVITITGKNLSEATSIQFGNAFGSSFTKLSSTMLTAVVGSGATGDVRVSLGDKLLALPGFTFIPIPTIELFTPTTAAIGQTVTITGTGLTDASSVMFGGVEAQSFQVISPTTIEAVVSTGATGSIAATTYGGTATLTGFTFIDPPSVTSFFPNVGGPTTQVLIEGIYFATTTSVLFGGVAAESFEVISDTKIKALVGANATSGAVSVVGPRGTGSLGGFTFDAEVMGIENPAQNSFQVFPNPFDGQRLKLSFHRTWEGKEVKVRLTDMTGKVLDSTVVTGYGETTWECKRELSDGMYFISAEQDKKRVVKKVKVSE